MSSTQAECAWYTMMVYGFCWLFLFLSLESIWWSSVLEISCIIFVLFPLVQDQDYQVRHQHADRTSCRYHWLWVAFIDLFLALQSLVQLCLYAVPRGDFVTVQLKNGIKFLFRKLISLPLLLRHAKDQMNVVHFMICHLAIMV